MGRGLVWEPHYPSAVAETEVIHGDISRDKSEIDVGGMLTEKDDSTKSAKRLKRDNTCVVDFYSPSHGFVGDLISTVLNWLQFDTSSSRLLRSQIRDCLAANPNQTVTVHAHSRGGAVLENALSKMTPEERGKIRIYTYGSAALIHPSLAKEVVNFVASNDPIPTLCNPIRFLRVFFGEQYNIIKIRSTVNPYTAHGIEERPYLTARAMAIMGKIDWVPP